MTPSLPEVFIERTQQLFGPARFGRFMRAFSEEPPVSIRLNPQKTQGMAVADSDGQVPWCPLGYYLKGRPPFTFDPLLHAGCYYVQEAASMFTHHVLTSLVAGPVAILDLCAAPGGKSTCAIAAAAPGSTLTANEPVRRRASILLENVTKWGYPDSTVTSVMPADYAAMRREAYDVVLCDVPCSGEGMFRRDAATIAEWSVENVGRCAALQREIVESAWHTLRPGGLLIYSTCTFNTLEDEENVQWIISTLGAEPVSVPTEAGWGIEGSLLDGFTAPVYRFIPGLTRSEGLFVAVVRKPGNAAVRKEKKASRRKPVHDIEPLQPPTTPLLPAPAEGIAAPSVCNLGYAEAIAYLRGEAVALPEDMPRGLTTMAYQGHTLGLAKNIGTRANNMHPKEWRIKSTHLPDSPVTVLVKTN